MLLDVLHQLSRHRDGVETLTINPEYASLLASSGIDSAAAMVNCEGAIISGHPDRHVMRVQIGGLPCYLKREHRVPLRDRWSSWRAGFGFVSVSVREARTLQMLRDMGIAAPEWLAAGETADGRAGLLLRDVGAAASLRDHLVALSAEMRQQRRRIARRLARQVARVHACGLVHPDLFAKHVLVKGDGKEFVILDWQRSYRRARLTWRERCRDLAALNASLADDLADADDRLTFLIAYWRATADRSVSFRGACRMIQQRTRHLLRRSSLREQRAPKVRESQALHWLAGDRLCLTDLARERLDAREILALAYLDRDRLMTASRDIRLTGGLRCRLSTRRTMRPLGRIGDLLRGRRWQAPECREAAQALRNERAGAAPTLLAFGQWRRSWHAVDSFLLQLAAPAGGAS